MGCEKNVQNYKNIIFIIYKNIILLFIKIEEEIQDEGIENIFNKVMEKNSQIRESDIYPGTNGIQLELE